MVGNSLANTLHTVSITCGVDPGGPPQAGPVARAGPLLAGPVAGAGPPLAGPVAGRCEADLGEALVRRPLQAGPGGVDPGGPMGAGPGRAGSRAGPPRAERRTMTMVARQSEPKKLSGLR